MSLDELCQLAEWGERHEFIFLLCQGVVSLNKDFLSSHCKILRCELRVMLFDFTNPVRNNIWKTNTFSCLTFTVQFIIFNLIQWIRYQTLLFPARSTYVWPKNISTRRTQGVRKSHLTLAVRQRSVVSVQFVVSGPLSTDWRVERRPLGGCRGQRFPLAKTADRTDQSVHILKPGEVLQK